jgi:hypothetical protein
VEKILEVVLEETYLGPVTALTIFDPKIIAGWIRIGRTGDSDLSWPRLPRGWKSHIGFGCFFFVDASRNYILDFISILLS